MQEFPSQTKGDTVDLDESSQNQAPDVQLTPETVDLDEGRQNEVIENKRPPFVLEESQEKTRARLAMGLLLLLGGSLIGIAVYIALNKDDVTNRELITLVWTSLVTLASSALGFYFGSKGN
ncbi:hypothetical protein [Pseudanabaena sp. PCC 6802]|uniref:hypothetical protein n=1 Tax=Pseudanabaena sp. PCC 6802 TaxID=118173 RepID=UPI00034D9163|nr:hypothetical protein [Pseudanabaena sp. PCC 6802]